MLFGLGSQFNELAYAFLADFRVYVILRYYKLRSHFFEKQIDDDE